MDELDVFRAVAHPVRRKIVAAVVGGPQSFSALRQLARRSDATLAAHLRILREAKVMAATRKGHAVEYRINRRLLKSAAHWFTRMAEDNDDASNSKSRAVS